MIMDERMAASAVMRSWLCPPRLRDLKIMTAPQRRAGGDLSGRAGGKRGRELAEKSRRRRRVRLDQMAEKKQFVLEYLYFVENI
jgi:hypothetical protein